MSELTISTLSQIPCQAFDADANVQDALDKLEPGQAIVVIVGQRGQPLGVITAEQAAALAGSPGSLADHRPLWQPPTCVLPETRLADVLRAMRSDKSIRWQAVLRAGQPVGLVSPDTLFEVSRSGAALQGDAGLAMAVYGDPVAGPPGLCYLCSADPAHAIPPKRVEERTADGQALCPCDSTPMVGTFVCPQEFSPC